MIALLQQHVIDLLPLRRETKAARVQPFARSLPFDFFSTALIARANNA
jgi:hypothetical protein